MAANRDTAAALAALPSPRARLLLTSTDASKVAHDRFVERASNSSYFQESWFFGSA